MIIKCIYSSNLVEYISVYKNDFRCYNPITYSSFDQSMLSIEIAQVLTSILDHCDYLVIYQLIKKSTDYKNNMIQACPSAQYRTCILSKRNLLCTLDQIIPNDPIIKDFVKPIIKLF